MARAVRLPLGPLFATYVCLCIPAGGDVAARVFEDSSGTSWEVFEVRRASEAPRGVSPGLEKGWLAFVSADTKRRLAPFPSDWADTSDAELEALLNASRERGAPRPTPTLPLRALSMVPSDPSTDMVHQTVREFARDARARGIPVIGALMELKSVLVQRYAGAGEYDRTRASDIRQVRRWFVDAYYFDDPPLPAQTNQS